MEEFLNELPDKIVADDIQDYLSRKTNKHFFSDIYNGRTVLSPNELMQYYSNEDIICLYDGGLGMGNYSRVAYSTKENKYIYYTMNSNEDPREDFKSDDWKKFHTHVRKELLELCIWFDKH
jgi:hypothetical protein